MRLSPPLGVGLVELKLLPTKTAARAVVPDGVFLNLAAAHQGKVMTAVLELEEIRVIGRAAVAAVRALWAGVHQPDLAVMAALARLQASQEVA
jgi:hypothetical protein